MLIDAVVDCLGGTKREIQRKLFEDMVANPDGLALFNAGTGIGKSLAYISAQVVAGGPAVIAVPNHQLGLQLLDAIEKINENSALIGVEPVRAGRRIGYQEYISPDKVAELYDAYRDEGSRDNALLWDNLLLASKSVTESNLVQNFMSEYGGIPSGITIMDICCSQKDKSSRLLQRVRNEEPDLDVLIITHITLLASAAFSSLPPKFTSNARLIVDEADALIGAAEMMYSQRIAFSTIKRQAGLSKKITPVVSDLVEEIDALPDGIHFLPGLPSIWNNLIELSRVSGKALGECGFTSQIARFVGNSSRNAAISVTKGKATLLQLSTFAARIFAARVRDMSSVWLLSGTLDVTNQKTHSAIWLCRKLGIAEQPAFYGHYEPSRFGRATFALGRGPAPIVRESVSDSFIEFCADHVGDTMLICTVSHDEAERLSNALRSRGVVTVIEDRHGQSLSKSIEKFVTTPDPVVLVTARASVGADIRKPDGSQKFKKMMITRLPFTPPPDDGDVVWRAEKYGVQCSTVESLHYRDSLQKSVRRFLQTMGRGIRSEQDECEFLIMDSRMPAAGHRGGHTIFRDAIPERFFMDYMAARMLGDNGVVSDEESLEIFV